jgi:myo-inositol catabolism protein IolC
MAGTPGWRPSHDDPLFIMAMDHRASFGKTLFDVQDDHPDAAQLAAMRSAKQLIYEGLMEAVPGLSSGRAGVLVDEQYGQQVIDEAAADGAPVVLAVPVEASGHDWFTLQWGDQWLSHVVRIRPGYAKVLVRDNPDFDPARAGQDAGAYVRDIRPGLVVKVIAGNQAHGVEPALWKVEGLETVEAAEQVAAQAKAGGRDADLIVLGRDAPAERLDHWLEVASQVPAFVGFAIGRSIWEDAVREYEASDRGDSAADDARGTIAGRYLRFVAHWTA